MTVLIICSTAVTFFWRAAGAILSGKVRAHSPVFNAIACTAYALVGALILKLIVYPQGAAAETELLQRLLAIGGTLIVFFISRNVAAAAWCGSLVLLLLIK